MCCFLLSSLSFDCSDYLFHEFFCDVLLVIVFCILLRFHGKKNTMGGIHMFPIIIYSLLSRDS